LTGKGRNLFLFGILYKERVFSTERYMSYSLQFVIAASSAMVLNAVIIPLLIKLAVRYDWYDNENERKIHTGNIPRIGGLGIAVSFFAVILLFFSVKGLLFGNTSLLHSFLSGYWAFFLGAAVISMIGLLDDFTDLRPLYKLFAQIAMALFIIFSGYYFKSFYIPFFDITLNSILLGKIITFIWIVGITNAVNLIDGLDGLSGGTTGIAAFFIGLTAYATGNMNQAVLVFILFGSIAGFLLYNFPPAKLFMGDSGSLFIGFVLSILPLYTLKGAITPYTPILSISFLFVPILDTLAAIIRRKIKRVPFHSPDREHLHHKLLAIGFSTRKVLVIIYSVTFILSLTAYLFSVTGYKGYITVLILLWTLFTVLFFILAVLVKKRSHKSTTE